MITLNKPYFDNDDLKMLNDVLYNYNNIDYCEAFEKSLNEYFSIPYVITTSSGTTALMTALKAVGVKKDDKIITTPFTFVATANAIRYCDAIPLFADIDLTTFNISPESIENILKHEKNVKYILVVHLFGQSCDMSNIVEIAQKHNLIIIEDCAQAIGATWNNQYVGTFGAVSTFSFYKTKNITTMEGGAIFTNNKLIYDKCKHYINHGINDGEFVDLGYNFRMNALSAGIGISQLKKLRKYNEHRVWSASKYNSLNQESLILPLVMVNANHVFSQYTLRVLERRNEMQSYLNDKGIDARVYYLKVISDNVHLKKYIKYEIPHALQATREVLSLPLGAHITEQDINIVIKTINDFYE